MNRRIHWTKQTYLLLLLLLVPFACDNGSNPILQQFPNEAAVELSSFALINQDRSQAGLPALSLDSKVSAIARRHSADMRDRNYFAHTNPDGKTPANRLRSGGISFHTSGENIARTSGMNDPARSANNEFLADSIHRKVLLNSQFTRVGVGVTRSGSDYWITQDFIEQ